MKRYRSTNRGRRRQGEREAPKIDKKVGTLMESFANILLYTDIPYVDAYEYLKMHWLRKSSQFNKEDNVFLMADGYELYKPFEYRVNIPIWMSFSWFHRNNPFL